MKHVIVVQRQVDDIIMMRWEADRFERGFYITTLGF